MSKHTPGPWEVMDGFYPSMKEVFGASFKINCVMWATDLTEEDYQKRKADLHLIAAAPDLLKALKECRNAIQGGQPLEPYDSRGAGYQQQFGAAFLEYLNAAIAKATGEAA
jgi:hypothetical protein